MLRQYKHYSSDFDQWDQKAHAQKYLLYPNNIGPHLSIDEVALSKGELVTLLTNKAAKGGKGSLVAMIAGTRMAENMAGAILHAFEQKMEDFYGCAQSLQALKETILNYFHNRATNASAESFNAKIKGFSPPLADSKRHK